MEIKPIEIANICSIFISNRTLKISHQNLILYSRLSMLIDSDNSPENIIAYSIKIGILNRIDNYIFASDIAKNLGKLQARPNFNLNPKTQDFFIKNILLNSSLSSLEFIPVIKLFAPSQEYASYVYYRTFQEDTYLINWLKTLNSLGLTLNLGSVIVIRKEYQEVLNSFLFKLRIKSSNDIESREEIRKEIGDIAELMAMEYERKRLTKNGFPELAKIIERHSLIDNYLGYDIMSFQGSGSFPARKRYIEVKGTIQSNYQFVFTKNERIVATEKRSLYWIYCFKNVKPPSLIYCKPLLICNPINSLKKMKVKEEPIDILYLFET